MNRRLAALAVAAAAFLPVAPADAACVGTVCVNAPYCERPFCLGPLLEFECSWEAQALCDVRDLIHP